MSKKKAHNGLGAIFPPQKMKQISLPELKKILTETPSFQESRVHTRDGLLAKLESKCHEVNPKDLPCSRSVVSVLTDKPRFFVRPSDPLDLENFLDVCELLRNIYEVLNVGPKNEMWLAEAGYNIGWRQARLNIRPFEGDVKNSVDKEERDKQNLARQSKVTPEEFEAAWAKTGETCKSREFDQVDLRKKRTAEILGISKSQLNRILKKWKDQGTGKDVS